MDYDQNLRLMCDLTAKLFLRIRDFTIAYDWPL